MRTLRFTACGSLLLVLAAGAAVLAWPVPAAAQGATDEPPSYTTEEIIERLDIAPQPVVRVRGLAPRTPADEAPTVRGLRPLEGPAPVATSPGPAAASPAPQPGPPSTVQEVAAQPVGRIDDFRVLFEFNSAELTGEAREDLDRLGAALVSDRLRSFAFRIAGHTDAVGDPDYNLQLSRRRAESVVSYLSERFGIDRSRLQSEGYGESRLYDPNSPNSGVNRRVEIVNLGQAAIQ